MVVSKFLLSSSTFGVGNRSAGFSILPGDVPTTTLT